MTTLFYDPAQFEIAQLVDTGVYLMRQNRFAEAIENFDRVLYLDPTDRYARWNRVLARLSIGDYVNGLPEHDCAWKIYDWRNLGPVEGNIDRLWNLPKWKGERCKLILYHEMGFGDAIMTLRFLPEIVSRCESVTLAVPKEVVALMEGHGATVIDHVPQDLSGFDARETFFNSIYVMGHSLGSIPSEPYIKVNFDPRPNTMGIVWSGNSQTEFDHRTFLRWLDTRGYELFALQPSKVTLDADGMHPLECKDFKETAEFAATLDAIVTIDTSMAHLAGAIGHPNAHVLIPYLRDWRWWNKNTWYPTLQIYPQDRPKDWTAPFGRLNGILQRTHP